MGWNRGSDILDQIWKFQRGYIKAQDRSEVFTKLAEIFWNNDCDILDELICDNWPEVEPALRDIGYIDEDE